MNSHYNSLCSHFVIFGVMVSSKHIHCTIISPEFTRQPSVCYRTSSPKTTTSLSRYCLRRTQDRFDLELWTCAGNKRWKRLVAYCDYGLDPSLSQDWLLSLRIASCLSVALKVSVSHTRVRFELPCPAVSCWWNPGGVAEPEHLNVPLQQTAQRLRDFPRPFSPIPVSFSTLSINCNRSESDHRLSDVRFNRTPKPFPDSTSFQSASSPACFALSICLTPIIASCI